MWENLFMKSYLTKCEIIHIGGELKILNVGKSSAGDQSLHQRTQ